MVLVLPIHGGRLYVERVLRAGVRGYVIEEVTRQTLTTLQAIRAAPA